MMISGLQSVWCARAQPQVVQKQQSPRQTDRQCPYTREVGGAKSKGVIEGLE